MSDTPQLQNRSSIDPISGVTFNILTIPNSSPLSKYKTATPVVQKVLEDIKSEDIVESELDNTDLGQEYFKEDPDQEPEEDENTIRRRYQNGKLTNLYECYFKPGVFLEFLVYHALYFCLLGPAIVILAPLVGWKVLYNQQFFGMSFGAFRQFIEFAIVVSFLIVFYMTDMIGMQAIEVYMMLVGILIRIIIISSKYSYQTLCFLKMVHQTKLNRQDRDNDNLLGRWRLQNDEIIQEEIQSAVLRLEIDSPLFFFNFLGEVSQELKNKLSKKSKLGKMLTIAKKNPNDGEEMLSPAKGSETARSFNKTMTIAKSPRDPGSEQVSYIDRSMNSTSFRPLLASGTSAVFRAFSHFFDYKQLEEKYLYGYSVAFDLIKHSREVRYDNMGKKMLALSIFRALIPTFYRIYQICYKKEDISLVTDKPYIVVIIFILNSFLFWANSFMLVQSVQAFKSKIWCFKQIGYMISPKKIHYFKERKLYPTLNIFDPITLKTWANLRKIMKEYGKKYFLRNNLNIAIAMVFYFFIFVTLMLQAFGIFTAYSDPLMFIVFGFETVVYFVIFASVMTGAAFLNNQYKVHKNLLKKNKTIIADFQRLSHLYVGKDAIKPDNIIYKEGLRVLKNELGEDCFQEKLIERAELLTGMIDDIIEDLEFEETNEPFTVMGVAVDYNLLKSLTLGGVSLAFALGQSLAN